MPDLFEEPRIEIVKSAVISVCGLYRMRLTRRWAPGPLLPFCMLNPSTADHEVDDPTAGRTVSFARREGAGGVWLENVYGFRATRPEALKARNGCRDPFGPDNDEALRVMAVEAAAAGMPIVCAWGASGGLFGGDLRALKIFRDAGAKTVCLGVTANGMPRHPLYVRGDQPLIPYRETSK